MQILINDNEMQFSNHYLKVNV